MEDQVRRRETPSADCKGLVVTVLRAASELRLETHCLDDDGEGGVLPNLTTLVSHHDVPVPLVGHRCRSGWTRDVVRAFRDQAIVVAHVGPVSPPPETSLETTVGGMDFHLTTRLNEAGVATIVRQSLHGDSVNTVPVQDVVTAHADWLRTLAAVWAASGRLWLADPLGEF